MRRISRPAPQVDRQLDRLQPRSLNECPRRRGEHFSQELKPPRGQHYERWFHKDGRGEALQKLYETQLPPRSTAMQTFHSALPVAFPKGGYQGGYIVEPVGRGEIELGIHQISEILPVKGVKLVGPLPPELQKYTTYVAAPVKPSRLAADFIEHLPGPDARARLAAAGYSAPQ